MSVDGDRATGHCRPPHEFRGRGHTSRRGLDDWDVSGHGNWVEHEGHAIKLVENPGAKTEHSIYFPYVEVGSSEKEVL